MRWTADARRLGTGIWACALLGCVTLQAQQEPANILILNSYEETSAPYFQPIRHFREALEQNDPGTIVFRHLDLMYEGSAAEDQTGESITRLLRSRYAEDPPDLVIAAGPPAVDFWVRYRDAIFPDAPL